MMVGREHLSAVLEIKAQTIIFNCHFHVSLNICCINFFGETQFKLKKLVQVFCVALEVHICLILQFGEI